MDSYSKLPKTICKVFFIILTLIFILPGCSKEEAPSNLGKVVIEISGRDERPTPIYRAKVPIDWIQIHPKDKRFIQDTTEAIFEFRIEEGNACIRITIHNFPSEKIEDRVPPVAQTSRWQRQFDPIDPSKTHIYPVSWGGFSGIAIEAEGNNDCKRQALLGWSMQLYKDHYTCLEAFENKAAEQMRADYTIKAIGNAPLMEKHKEDIIAFAKSFELINEIPMSP